FWFLTAFIPSGWMFVLTMAERTGSYPLEVCSLSNAVFIRWLPRLFATDQYFDSHGFFILCVWSAPILINAMLITILLLLQVGQLLVQKKRLEWNVGARKKSEKKKL
ncbi:transmembrane protein 18, partial [Paragonimus westermani]